MAVDTDLPPDLPELPADWAWRPLGDIALRERGICYGIVQPGQEVADGVPVLRVQDLGSGTVDASAVKKVHPDVEAAYQRSRLRGGEILLSLVGTLGSVVLAPPDVAGFNVARAVGVIPVEEEVALFTTLAMRSPLVQRYCRQWATTTVQATLNLRDVKRLPIPWPPLDEQRRIAAILGALDDKIELNRKMNRTLEELAQALFKSWFIDFDGHDDLVDSEIGPVPRGWGVGSVYEIADVFYGAPFQSKLFNTDGSGLPLIRIRDLSTHSPDIYTTEEHPKGRRIVAGDLVVGMDGEFRAHLWRGPPSWMNQRVCQFVPKAPASTGFVFFSIQVPLAFYERAKTGTTVIHIGKADIDKFRVLIPPRVTIEAFARIADPLLRRAVENGRESAMLADLRDTLLPKLISGELRAPEAEVLVEAAG